VQYEHQVRTRSSDQGQLKATRAKMLENPIPAMYNFDSHNSGSIELKK